uniref:Uncharacterized protein n=1 Tax=Nelumbo nucifera TaxID=4432 RepID=A0A822ZA36_NELNU|nr:TPA_asm: hypothetical protein HUJ06_014628 [Nelumbo nucifera]
MARSERSVTLSAVSATEPTSLCLSSTSLFAPVGADRRQFALPPQPAMSATVCFRKQHLST